MYNEFGDATEGKTKEKIEFKATSRFKGNLSLFGSKYNFDELLFADAKKLDSDAIFNIRRCKKYEKISADYEKVVRRN